MFSQSVFELYDPHDSNDCYVAVNGNKYVRHAAAFDYTSDVVKYDAVQDDAFVTFHGNREKIDPGHYLFMARRFSCKRLDEDDAYFKVMRGNVSSELFCCDGCRDKGTCYKDRFAYFAAKGYRQVGKVATSEQRVMSHLPTIGQIRDKRFGTCNFCREMFFYCQNDYPEGFFNNLASIHSIGSRCSIKSRYVSPKSDGNVEIQGRKMHVVREILDPVCLPYDQVLDLPLTTNFVCTSKRTYVFSSFENIQYYMYTARVAVYDKSSNIYYVNYLDTDFCQSDVYDMLVNGVRFKLVQEFKRGIRDFKLFSGRLEGLPIVTSVNVGKSFSLFLDIARYYGSFYLELGDEKYVLV